MPVPRGMRDFPPQTAILRKEVFSRIEKVFSKFGFDPLETPIVELWDTLRGKYGPEAENKLVYAFKDRFGETELALRYDLTVPLARFISENPSLPLPFKRYAVGQVYRHEEPQKGRYREFYQCDADIVGSSLPEADAEIICLVGAVMNEFKLPGYTVKVNDRRLLSGIFEKGIGVGQNLAEVYREIDKLDKIGWLKVSEQLKQIIPLDKVKQIKDVIDICGGPFEVMDEIQGSFGKIPQVNEALLHLAEMFTLAKKVNCRLELGMVRGLDYYTGPIFETVVKEPKIGSLTGGGRYDGLLGVYGKALPATGTTIGVERLLDAGIELGLFKSAKKTISDAYVVDLGVKEYAWRVAGALRDAGINTRLDLLGRKSPKQLEEADKLGVRFVVIVGNKEESAGTVTVVDKSKEKENKFTEKLIEARTRIRNLLAV
jgi:histidyl-tRNA synthetase